MRVPTPRLRQVFEHTTHFKVTRPGKNPIVIAKKSLSPKMISRLQAFAKGGEVGHYADGIDVPDAAAQDADISNILSLPAATGEPEEVEPPVPSTSRQVFTGVEPSTVPTDAEDIAAEQARIAAAKSPPVVVNVVNPAPPTQAFAAPTQEQTVEPEPTEAKAPAEVAPVKPKQGAQIVPGYVPEPEAAPFLYKVGGKTYSVSQVMRADLSGAARPEPATVTTTPVAAPTPAVAAAPEELPIEEPPPVSTSRKVIREVEVRGKPPSAPAEAPATAAAPAVPPPPPVPLTPVEVSVALPPPEKVERAIAEGLKANKPAAEIIGDLFKSVPAIPGLDPKALVSPVAEAIAANTPADEIAKGLEQQLEGVKQQAAASYATEQAIAQAADQRYKDLAAINAQHQADILKAQEHSAALRKAIEDGADYKGYFASHDWPQNVGTILAMAVGGFLSGYAGTQNYVYDAFNKAIERDLDAQKRRRESWLKLYEDARLDEQSKRKLAEADMKDMSAMYVESLAARSKAAGVVPAAMQLSGKMRLDAAKLRADVNDKVADNARAEAESAARIRVSEALAEKYGAQAKTGGFAPRAPSAISPVSAERLAFAKAKYEAGKRFSVPDPSDPAKQIFISASSEQTAKRIIPELQQRIDGIMRVEDFTNWLKENANKPVSPQSIKQMQTKIAGIVENYPGIAKGAKSLVTVAQAKLLKPAITSTTIPILQFMDVLGLTSTAMKDIRNDAARGVLTSIKTAAAENDPGAKEFLSKWSPEGYRGRTGYVFETPAAEAKTRAGLKPAF